MSERSEWSGGGVSVVSVVREGCNLFFDEEGEVSRVFFGSVVVCFDMDLEWLVDEVFVWRVWWCWGFLGWNIVVEFFGFDG